MKTLLKFLKSKFFWINIAASALVFALVYVAILIYLRTYTHHGESYEVPDLKGLYVEEAELILADTPISFEVIDSVYKRDLKPGEIAEQSPAPGTMVKSGRKIYLTANARHLQLVSVPYLVGESRRKVQSNLRSLGFNADSVRRVPYEFDDEVLALEYNGVPVDSAGRVPDGAMLVVVVGQTGEEEVTVPNLKGLRYNDAKQILDNLFLALGTVYFDINPISELDREKYYIYDQSPAAGVVVKGGKRVDISLSKIKGKSTSKTKSSDEDEFF